MGDAFSSEGGMEVIGRSGRVVVRATYRLKPPERLAGEKGRGSTGEVGCVTRASEVLRGHLPPISGERERVCENLEDNNGEWYSLRAWLG